MITLMLAALLPMTEMQTIREVAHEYSLSREQTALLVAIRKIENGKTGLEFGVAQEASPSHPARRFRNDPAKSFRVQAQWAAGTIKRRYTGNVAAFAKRWCPKNHANWTRMGRFFMARAANEI